MFFLAATASSSSRLSDGVSSAVACSQITQGGGGEARSEQFLPKVVVVFGTRLLKLAISACPVHANGRAHLEVWFVIAGS